MQVTQGSYLAPKRRGADEEIQSAPLKRQGLQRPGCTIGSGAEWGKQEDHVSFQEPSATQPWLTAGTSQLVPVLFVCLGFRLLVF